MARLPHDIPIGIYVRLAQAGLTHKQIADELFVSTAALSRWKNRNGITSYRDTLEYDVLRKDGLTDKEIAKRWRISPSALYQWKRSHGLVLNS